MTDVYQTLLKMMAGGQSAAEARASVMQMLSEQEGIDPTTRALLTQAMGRDNERGKETDVDGTADGHDEGDKDDEEEEERRAARRLGALRRLRHRFHAMEAELESLRAHNDRLAAALGACARCWGSDRDCHVCRGSGRSGASPPDRQLFRELVEPAIHASQAQRERRMVRPSDARPRGGTT